MKDKMSDGAEDATHAGSPQKRLMHSELLKVNKLNQEQCNIKNLFPLELG